MRRTKLLAWYDAHKRDLPWRRTRDPYAIWVSEIMLQQTRVETVIPYYTRFLERFPTAHALADAPLDDVLAHWSGLGYYRRARLLHEGAKAVVATHGGLLPRDPAARRALPGVGAYTAGAIGSIAFDLPEPIVDGNVARVLSRLELIETPLGERATERVLWERAAELAVGERPGELNQALMELGARVCTPLNAKCGACPLRDDCRARSEGKVDELPVPAKKKPPKPVSLVALVARTQDDALWLMRSDGSLFGGLWGFPLAEGAGRKLAGTLADGLALHGTLSRRAVGNITHILSHRALTVEVFVLRATEGTATECLRPVAEQELHTLGIASLTRKILTAARSAVAT
ncbi:MAG TPA: A/G-specific adenine glycosylase [Polyangiales bacterium]|nr:A/G-specific adenine glycosylase [Polyangiales bacterium]